MSLASKMYQLNPTCGLTGSLNRAASVSAINFVLKRARLFFLLPVFYATQANSEFADHVYLQTGNVKSSGHSSPSAPVSYVLSSEVKKLRHIVHKYKGENSALTESATQTECRVGAGEALGWISADLFDDSEKSNGRYQWQAAITSIDATALRIQVDLSALDLGEELWVTDIIGTRSFGPYTIWDAENGGRWLPTTIGDSCIVTVASPNPILPELKLLTLSHIYEDLLSKQLPCPISADCITDPKLQEVSTGIGRMTVTDSTGETSLCTGALLNNADTEEVEPWFFTADHCFQGFAGTISPSGIEVVWDFRADGCDGPEPDEAAFASLPRSTGAAILATDANLDAALVELEDVPVGALGRAYLGWDTRAPEFDEEVIGLHHPDGESMKQNIGTVDAIDVDTSLGQNQNTISWSEGITEGGSSGSPALYDDGTFRVFGVLSNGNLQFCDSTNPRLDQYASFRDFFPAIRPYLTTKPVGGEGEGEGEGEEPDGCTGSKSSSNERSHAARADFVLYGTLIAGLTRLSRRRRT